MPCSSLEPAGTISLGAGDKAVAVRLENDGYKTVRLKVKPDGTVLVRAPRGLAQKTLEAWLVGHMAWILAQQDYFRRLRLERPVPGYNAGDIQRFLGRDYALHVAPHVRGGVFFAETGFHVQTRGAVSEAKVRTLLERWFQDRAAAIFAERLAAWLPEVTRAGLLSGGAPPLKVRAMRSRFGSCSRGGVITLNRHLAAMPLSCIDYVLVHELCHLRHFAHDRPFYRLLQMLMPDWRARKALLKDYWLTQF